MGVAGIYIHVAALKLEITPKFCVLMLIWIFCGRTAANCGWSDHHFIVIVIDSPVCVLFAYSGGFCFGRQNIAMFVYYAGLRGLHADSDSCCRGQQQRRRGVYRDSCC